MDQAAPAILLHTPVLFKHHLHTRSLQLPSFVGSERLTNRNGNRQTMSVRCDVAEIQGNQPAGDQNELDHALNILLPQGQPSNDQQIVSTPDIKYVLY